MKYTIEQLRIDVEDFDKVHDLNGQIALYCGYEHLYSGVKNEMRWYNLEGTSSINPPSFVFSLDLMHQALLTFNKTQKLEYYNNLHAVFAPNISILNILLASAKEQAIAFIMTKQNGQCESMAE